MKINSAHHIFFTISVIFFFFFFSNYQQLESTLKTNNGKLDGINKKADVLAKKQEKLRNDKVNRIEILVI